MLKKLKITVDGRPYTVTVEDMSDEGSHWYPEPGLTEEATRAPAPAPAAAPAPAPAAAPAAAGAGDEVCPLSGVVVSIDVTVGQEVKEGDKIATLEAMKMKTVVSAHRSGKVTNIAAKPGDGVEAGQVLLTIS